VTAAKNSQELRKLLNDLEIDRIKALQKSH
jgi:hypothetical protein